jgi:hypothetical protein
MLIRHLNIDMFEMDRITEILGGAVEFVLHGGGPDTNVSASYGGAAPRANT